MNLFINYYDTSTRQKEIDFCLKTNLANEHIERIILFNESSNPLKHSKIIRKDITTRPTYQDFFNATRDYPNDVNIISNSDIYFNDSIGNAENIRDRMCYALTRSEVIKGEIVSFEDANSHNSGCKAEFSQDVWIFRGGCTMEGCGDVTAVRVNNRTIYKEIPFTIGVPGCDNVIAAMLKRKYQVKNPAYDIQCIHKHRGKSRNVYDYRMTGGRSTWGIIHQGRIPITGL